MLKSGLSCVFLITILLPVLGLSLRDDSNLPRTKLSVEQWRQDLHFLATELPKRHANAFHHVSHEQFQAAVSDLDRRLEGMDADEAYVGLNTLANQIGDAHTFVRFPSDIAKLPLDIVAFGNDYRVTRVGAGLEKSLGTRVLKLQGIPIEKVLATISSMTPQDETPQLSQARALGFSTIGMVLRGFKIVPDRTKARFTLADDGGGEFELDVQSLGPNAKPNWVTVYKEIPLFRQKPEEAFWYTYLADANTIYCSFRGYSGLGKAADGLFKLVEQKHPDKLVIDMRQNGGGDYTLGLRFLVNPISKLMSINQKGHLFILIGVNTFSAAMSNSAHFRAQTAAILVGQTIGEKPNSYQESRHLTLPNSHLVVNYSVRLYKFVENGENIIRPDQEIIPTWVDFKAGSDPALGWILQYKAK
jgi:hypothetical protein